MERGAQDLVATDDLVERPAERRDVEPAVEPRRERHVVGNAPWIELGDEPEPFLTERERRGPPGGRAVGNDWLDGGAVPITPGAIDRRSHPRGGRRCEHGREGKLDPEDVAHSGEQAGGEQRMPAEREEVVARGDPFDAEQLAPDPTDQLPGRRKRRS